VARGIIFTVLERGIIRLSYGMRFISVGWKAKKLLTVKFDNLCYFWDLLAYVTFVTYFFAWVTLSFLLSYILDFLQLLLTSGITI